MYCYSIPKPSGCFDVSTLALDELADAVCAIASHQHSGHIWFGYLEGWMLTPHEETRIRPALRKFECSLITVFPLSLSQAWKNELRRVYTSPPTHGDSNSNDNGGSLQDGRAVGHGSPCPGVAVDGERHQN